MLVLSVPALAQSGDTSPALEPGQIFLAAREYTQPLADLLAGALAGIVLIWNYLMENPPAAVLLSGIIAYYVAMRSIASQREMTRLRETFTTIDAGIRDGDIIKSRIDFRAIRNDLSKNNESIAKYHNPIDNDIPKGITLRTIMNDYENIGLGVRYNILDEEYLFRWMKSTTVADWNALMPLVTAYRSAGAPNAYIEFEGLAAAWLQEKSYRTGKKIKAPNRRTKIA